ncbi:TetR family transcriptional regulator [Brevibacterium sp. CFH 10365]|uniref:TetR family transcriptional regulator n=1 Tax=Brevibacterium sp. CFH 10365 TaxID=2585207 RepID=UPI001D0D4AA2|nr:TetR family transcriptional regulator C-terminal domain-containing protein [Brevibacterium sp. CFH 10365]
MVVMMSNSGRARVRKPSSERRREILAAAAVIALDEGLEAITLRAVAARLDVRPGLVSHYFPVVGALVVEAFTTAAREGQLDTRSSDDTPAERLAAIIGDLRSEEAHAQFRLWSSARNVSRTSAAMAMALEELEEAGRSRLIELIESGIRAGEFGDVDAIAACVRIYMAIDGYGTYANNPLPFDHDSYEFFIADVAEWALGLAPGTLRSVRNARQAVSPG